MLLPTAFSLWLSAAAVALGRRCEAEVPARIAEAVVGRNAVMTLVALPPLLTVVAIAFGRHVSGAVVAIEKLGPSGSGEQQSGLLALGAFTPVPRWLREFTPG